MAPSHEEQNGAAAKSAVAGAEFAYPNGHLEHLTAPEAAALKSFKDLLITKGRYTAGAPPSHDDSTLIRFLRARRWVPEDALTQFSDTEDWRKANDINVLYQTIDIDAYEQSRVLYPQWTGRRDRKGIPVYTFQIRSLDSKSVVDYEKTGATTNFSKAKTDGKTPAGMLRLFALYENLCQFVFPFSTQLQDRQFANMPISMSTNIIDVSGVSLRQFWSLKNHMQVASTLATANYPETLDRIFVIGAPAFFSTIWGWIKRWFDPATVSKIFILAPNEVTEVLTSFIDPKNLPKQYGGELDFNWGDLPTVDPAWAGALEWADGYKSFPTGPMVWQPYGDGSRLECLGLGYKNGKPRRDRICTIPKTYLQPWEKEALETTASQTARGSNETAVASEEPATKMAELSIGDEKNPKNAAVEQAENGVVAPSA
ncbi:Sec14 cytosolic factor [Ceratocystis lukuohia]|uniref:Sec14 cytosolic factor n=2 Tax=Ceratocystis TaxID=5157 RepID=A0A0F8B0Q7_CERFI|nr:Sec14 cytosolic factor [Ceratocystis platani]